MNTRILSAGVVVVNRKSSGDWQYLLLRAYDHWDFPKGEVETGEEPLAAARREVAEETGIRRLSFNWGEGFRETPPYRRGSKTARYYLATTDETDLTLPLNPALGRPEHHEYRWVEEREARFLLSPRLLPILQWAADTISVGRIP